MNQITEIKGMVLVLQGADVDTDRIIPARYLKTVSFIGLGQHVFEDDRKKLGGKHPFDLPENQGANILIAGENFGCGSSREHAPQALMDWGITAIIAPSFAAIFRGNCTANGIPCLTASEKGMDLLQQKSRYHNLTIDLTKMTATGYYNDEGDEPQTVFTVSLNLPANDRQMLIEGEWDTTGTLLDAGNQIEETLTRLPYGTLSVA